MRGNLEAYRKPYTRGEQESRPSQSINTEDIVQQVYRERNKRADKLANEGASGSPSMRVNNLTNKETWKAVCGYSV